MVTTKAKKDDFKTAEQLQEVSSQINQPDKFANIFCDAAKSQVIIKETISEIITKLLNTDSATRQSIKKMIRGVDKEDWKNFIKKIGFAGWTAIVSAFWIVLTTIINHKWFK